MRRLPLALALATLLPVAALAQTQPAAKETKYRSACLLYTSRCV